MKEAYEFDFVFDSQKVFRLIMEALSNPGKILCIAEYKDKLVGDYTELLAVGIALLDNEVSFSTCKNKELSEEIVTMTLSNEEDITHADYIFISENQLEKSLHVVESAKIGTLKDPHKSATIITWVKDLKGTPNARVSGPGVNGHRDIFLVYLMKLMLETRDKMYYEYPTGLDLLFVDTQGNLMAIPRKIIVEELV